MYDVEIEDCPIITAHCNYFSYQCDNFGEVAISHCTHPNNKSEFEGNCTHTLCPLTKPTKDYS